MRSWLAVLLLLCVSNVPVWGAEPSAFPDLHINDVGAVREASRVLEEELKLAARPQTYVVIDLAVGAISIKGRGVELHRMPISRWSAEGVAAMTGTFRVRARPPVTRRKVDPGIVVEQEPISLADMPVRYELLLAPLLTVGVHPPLTENPWLWSLASSHRLWGHMKNWAWGWLNDPGPTHPYLELALVAEEARSFAWSLVDGMPVVIRRAADH
ncbi:MAG: hypothetical protein ICV75_03600 [Nitrospiraceae bacterium]|nr:hypothetical protein [Nitrospiraceae bacterium]